MRKAASDVDRIVRGGMLEAGALRAVRLPALRALRFDVRDLERLIDLGKDSR